MIGSFIFLISILMLFSFNSFTPSMEGVTQTIDNVYSDIFTTELQDIGTNNAELNLLRYNNVTYNPYLTLDEYIWLLHSEWIGLVDGEEFWLNHSALLVGNATSWLPPTFGISYSINETVIYERDAALGFYNESVTKLSRRKITSLAPNITFVLEPVISEVVVWQ